MTLSQITNAISKMNAAELKTVSKAVNAAHDFNIAMTANSFSLRDEVSFIGRRGLVVVGTVIKVNPKNIKVRTAQGIWNVTATLLTKLEVTA
jgi:hypothetical protein